MTDKRKELVAFRYRIRARCGNNEFVTSERIFRAAKPRAKRCG